MMEEESDDDELTEDGKQLSVADTWYQAFKSQFNPENYGYAEDGDE